MTLFLFLPPATKLGQGNVLTPVCHFVHRGWRSLSKGGCLSGRTPVRLRTGGTHPTGTHSCCLCTFAEIIVKNDVTIIIDTHTIMTIPFKLTDWDTWCDREVHQYKAFIYMSMETCPRGVWTCDLIDPCTQGHVTSMTSGAVTRGMRSIQGGLAWYLQGSLFYIQCESRYIYAYISQCFVIQWWAGHELRGT